MQKRRWRQQHGVDERAWHSSARIRSWWQLGPKTMKEQLTLAVNPEKSFTGSCTSAIHRLQLPPIT